MKIKSSISVIAIASLCGALPAWAQKTNIRRDANTNYYNNGSTNYGSRYRDELATRNPERLGNLEQAKNILGAEIKDSQDHRLAKVKDLAIDLQNGRIVEVIVATGGVLGMDEAYVAVPPDQFTYDVTDKKLQLRADRQQLKSAPTFKMSDWEENVRQARVEEVYQYYSSKPYFTSSESAGSNSRSPHQLAQVERASKLMGTTVRNMQDEKLGKIENLVVDLPAGRLVEVVLASGGFLGLGDELSAVPPQSFRYGIHQDVLTLDTTKDALNQAPHFKSSDWQTANNPDQVSTVYRAYNVEPYFGANAVDNTAQNVRDRDTNSVTPFDQGSSQSDVDTTRQIRQQIMAADGLSVDARNVKVITRDGRVTLRGPVTNDQEKQTIADIAAQVASANVDNQLQVLNNPNSNPADTTTNLNK